MMRQLEAGHLPEHPLDAAGAFMAFYLESARALLAAPDCSALAIILPPAGHDHRDWRLTLARDLAREAAPAASMWLPGRRDRRATRCCALWRKRPG